MTPAVLERYAVETVASIAPWIAPAPTAWLVADRAIRYLHWPLWIAAIAGLTLELLGVGILATWLMLYGYNLSKRKTDPVAVMWLPTVLVVVYFLTAEALTVALDVWPAAAVVAPALFPVLSIAAFALLALRADHRQRLVDIADSKAERKRQRAEREQAEQPPEQVPIMPQMFACDICGSMFATQRALSGHGNKHRTNGDARQPLEVSHESNQQL